jgi:hypothetical protein
LGDARTRAQYCVREFNRAGEHAGCKPSGGQAGKELRGQKEQGASERECAGYDHAEGYLFADALVKASSAQGDTYSGIEQASTDPVKRPYVYEQRESIHERGEDVKLAAEMSVWEQILAGLGMEHDLSAKAEIKKHESPDKLSCCSNKVSLECGKMVSSSFASHWASALWFVERKMRHYEIWSLNRLVLDDREEGG